MCSDAWNYPELAEMVEAWGARLMFREEQFLPLRQVVGRWYAEEFAPITQLVRDAGLVRAGEGDGDAYLRAACDRYSLVRAHVWTDEVFDALRKARRA